MPDGLGLDRIHRHGVKEIWLRFVFWRNSMFRRAILALGLALAVTSFVVAQEPTAPPVPEDVLAPRELIAWSSLQTPQPAQKPVPPIQSQAREPNQDSAHGS